MVPRNFKLEILVYRRPNLRDYTVEMEMFIGRNVLDNLFDTMIVDTSITSCYFSFPETWLNVIEQRALFDRIEKYYPNVKSVKVKTHSVYIIQMGNKDEVFIVGADDEMTGKLGKPNDGDTGKLYVPMVGGLFPSDGSLKVFN